MSERDLADTFEAIANLLEIKGEPAYRVMAYRRASETLRGLGPEVRDIWERGELQALPGVGKAIAEKIDEFLRTGRLAFYEKLAAEVPAGLLDVLKVEGIGPKRAAQFWQELGITSLDALEQAAQSGQLRSLSGMGPRSEAKILAGIEALRGRETGRILLSQAWESAQAMLEYLKRGDGILHAEVAGSLRRGCETIGDLDLLVASDSPSKALEAVLGYGRITRVLARGETKTSLELQGGLRAQIWIHPLARWGSAMQYATGSQAHNVRLRELALVQGLSLSEHGFRRTDGGEILCREEAKVYETLGLPWIPPELREDRGEIQAAKEGRLPELVEITDLRGELHAHSTWSDGKASILEMAQVAMDMGMEYLVISDHSKGLGIAGGLNAEDLRRQREEIEAVQARLSRGPRILQGIEVEILADGSLDFPDEVLAGLDLVIASLHSSLKQERGRIMHRILRAIENPHVDIIGHLTGRLINRRDPADLDVEQALRAAAMHGTALEINAHPDRLDLKDVHARRAVELGCLLAINTDAHHPEHFGYQRFGVMTARRGWVPAQAVLNTWSLEKLLEWLHNRR